MIILYNTTNMSYVEDGQVRHIYNEEEDVRFKVTIPVGWVQVHPNQTMHLSKEWRWGDEYLGTPSDILELPNVIKAQFGLDAQQPPLYPAPQQGQVRGRPDDEPQLPPPQRRVGGKSKKRSATRRRCSSKRRMSKPRKARATRRK